MSLATPRWLLLVVTAAVAVGACTASSESAIEARPRSTSAVASTVTTASASPLCQEGAGYHAFVTALTPDPTVAEVRVRLLQSATWLGTLSTVTDEPLAGRLRVSARIRGELAAAVVDASSLADVDALVGALNASELAAYQQPPEEVEALLGRRCGLEFD